MLNERLKIARDLLTDNGVIFISIDDNEQAYLKVLCDEIFGESNFLCNFNWVKKHGPGGNTTFNNKIVSNTEYILFYAKNRDSAFLNSNIHDEKTLKKLGYINKDKYFDERGPYKITPLFRPSSTGSFQYSPTLDYKIKAESGEWFSLHCNKDGVKRGRYTWGKKTYEIGNKLGFIECRKNKDGDWVAYRKQYQYVKFNPKTHKIEKKAASSQYENIIDDFYSSEGGVDFVRVMGDKNLFAFPKPVNLIKYLINIFADQNCKILDFYAGSGTTGQSVMELNEEDSGGREFTLVTNNENNIGIDICYERLYRVIKGKGTKNQEIKYSYSDEIKFLESNNLNVFDIEHKDVKMNSKQLEKIKKEIRENLSLINPKYEMKKDFDILYDLTSLHPLSKEK